MSANKYPCRFNELNLPETCENFDRLIQNRSCPHINKAEECLGIRLYCCMDSCCQSSDCEKYHGNTLRMAVMANEDCRDFKTRVFKLRYVSPESRLLEFKGGTPAKDGSHVLEEEFTRAYTPLYPKLDPGKPWGVNVVKKQQPQTERVNVTIHALLWRVRASRAAGKRSSSAERGCFRGTTFSS